MKKLIALLLALVMVIGMVACGTKEEAAPAAKEEAAAPAAKEEVAAPAAKEEAPATLLAKPLTFKFCCSESEDTSYVQIMTAAFEEITKQTNGELLFEIYASNTLGAIGDTLEQMQAGAPLIVSSGMAEVADIASETMKITSIPYVFEDMKEILTLSHTDWIKGVQEELDASNIRGVCYGTQGYRHFVSTKPIYDASSIEGMIVRMGPAQGSQNFVTVLKGSPTTSTWADNYSLLQTGVIDACEASLELMYNSSLYEVCDYLTLSGHLASPFMCSMNGDQWAQIPAEYQEIFLSVLDAAMVDIWEAAVENETAFVQKFADTGIEIIETDKSTFTAAVPELMDMMGFASDAYDNLRNAIDGAQ